MNDAKTHFDEMTALLYLEGQLDAGHASEVSAHAGGCGACNELLNALKTESVWLREALVADDESIPARVIAAPERGTAHWGWIAALGLCTGGAYTLWSGFVEPWLTQASQAGFNQGNVLTMLFFSGAFWKGWDAMRSFMEFLAIATLGGVAFWLVRRRLQRFTAIAFVASALICAMALPPAAAAADVEHGDPSYTLPAGKEVKNDLIVAADRTRIEGDVDGDLIVFSDNVVVDGHVKGDIIGFAEELRINGPVDGNIRAFSQHLLLNGAVNKNVMAWTGAAELDEKATVGGTMTVGAQNLVLNGKAGGDLLAFAISSELNGSLGRDAMIRGNRLTIGPGAEIMGHTKYTGTQAPDVAASAKLGSPIQITVRKRGPDYTQVNYYWHQVMFWGASFLLGLVFLLVAPGFCFDAAQASKRIGPAVGFGALFLFATPIAAIVLCITIVGLSVGLPALMLYAIAVYAAQIFVGAWLGETLLGTGVGIGPALGRLALGLVILRALRMLPYVGPVIGLVTVMWGLGAVVLALHRRMTPQPVAVAAAA